MGKQRRVDAREVKEGIRLSKNKADIDNLETERIEAEEELDLNAGSQSNSEVKLCFYKGILYLFAVVGMTLGVVFLDRLSFDLILQVGMFPQWWQAVVSSVLAISSVIAIHLCISRERSVLERSLAFSAALLLIIANCILAYARGIGSGVGAVGLDLTVSKIVTFIFITLAVGLDIAGGLTLFRASALLKAGWPILTIFRIDRIKKQIRTLTLEGQGANKKWNPEQDVDRRSNGKRSPHLATAIANVK